MKLDERAQQASRAIHVAVDGVSPKPLPSRRVIAAKRAAVALVLVAIAGYFSSQLLDRANLGVETADQPPSEMREERSGEEAPGPVTSVSPGETSSPGTRGSSKDSRSGGSLPEGTIPQGFEIAFNCGDASDIWDICLMNADGSDLRKLRAGPAVEPEWSPDARLIAFTDNQGDIQFMKSDGSGVQNLGARGSSPSWSPDGGRLAFNWECDAQFGGTCDSPDGTENDCGPECGIGVVARDGSGVRRLGNGIWPDWGPDGRIIFTDGMPGSPCHYRPIGREDPLACTLPIWVMNPDGSGRTRLPVDRAISPTWSHDGRRIAYFTKTDGVFIANSDGTGVAKVAPAGYTQPSWSPDGLWLAVTGFSAYQELNCPGGGCHNIYLRGIDGSAERRLTYSNNDLFPAFSPRR